MEFGGKNGGGKNGAEMFDILEERIKEFTESNEGAKI